MKGIQPDAWIILLGLVPATATAAATITLATIEYKRRKNQQGKNLQMHVDALILWNVYIDVLLNINARNISCLNLIIKGVKNRYRDVNSLSLHQYPTYLASITQDTGLLNEEVRMQCESIKGGVHFGNTKVIDTNNDLEYFLPLTQNDTWAALTQPTLGDENGNDPFGYKQHLRHTIEGFEAYQKTLKQFHEELLLAKVYVLMHAEYLNSLTKEYKRQKSLEIKWFKSRKILKEVICYKVDRKAVGYIKLLESMRKTYSWK